MTAATSLIHICILNLWALYFGNYPLQCSALLWGNPGPQGEEGAPGGTNRLWQRPAGKGLASINAPRGSSLFPRAVVGYTASLVPTLGRTLKGAVQRP